MKTLMILSPLPDERAEMVLKEAAGLGYRTVLCSDRDYEATSSEADQFYLTDWNDTKALLDIADAEQIDGVVGLYDSVMEAAARIAVERKLPGNSPDSMRRLVSKEEFRILQKEAGVFCPASFVADTEEELKAGCACLQFPVIIKPMLCSSSKGLTVLESENGIPAAFQKAASFSRNGRVCAEEFIRNDLLRIIEADVFLIDGEFIWDGIRFNYRFENAPLQPAYDVYPVHLTEAEYDEFKDAVSRVLRASGARIGEYDIEGFFTPEGRFFIVEINPRQAGCYNPQDIELYCGVNLTRLLITTAVGDRSYYNKLKHFERFRRNVISFCAFSERPGILESVYIDPSLRPNLAACRFVQGQKPGDFVQDIHTAKRPVAKAVFRFDTAGELESVRRRIRKLVYPIVK